MATSTTSTPRAVEPWLDDEKICAHCLMRYARSVEVRCAQCDGPSCPHCVVRVDEALICAGCEGLGDDEPLLAEG